MIEVSESSPVSVPAACCDITYVQRLDPAAAQALSADVVLIGHPIRLQILDLLSQHGGHVCVCDLEAALTVKQPTVSHHLKLLREAGLVEVERRGLWAYYRVQCEAVTALRQRLIQMLDALAS